jgi:hypothetical protein
MKRHTCWMPKGLDDYNVPCPDCKGTGEEGDRMTKEENERCRKT